MISNVTTICPTMSQTVTTQLASKDTGMIKLAHESSNIRVIAVKMKPYFIL